VHGGDEGELGVLEDFGVAVVRRVRENKIVYGVNKTTSGALSHIPSGQLLVLHLLVRASRTYEPVVLTSLAGELAVALCSV